jgi:anti-sigma regulatory factor (Ser/Thr protein kinase)
MVEFALSPRERDVNAFHRASGPGQPMSFRHEALLYRGSRDFVERLVPFLAAGVARGEPTLVVVDQTKIDLLRSALNGDATSVQFMDMNDVGTNPARIIPAWQAFVNQFGGHGQPLRGVGEPIWPDRSPQELVECQAHEALLNYAFHEGPPWWLLCPYDASAVSSAVIDEACRSHPYLAEDGGHRTSDSYGGVPSALPFADAPLPEPDGQPHELEFGLADLATIRALVRQVARGAGLGEERTKDFVLAVSELANNSIRHADGRGRLRVWRDHGDGQAVVCEVRDSGRINDPIAGRHLPAQLEEHGRGLWLANQLCELVQIRTFGGSSVVRARMHVRSR